MIEDDALKIANDLVAENAQLKKLIQDFSRRNQELEQRNKILEGSKTTQVMLDEVKKLFQDAIDQRDSAEQKIYEFKRAVRRLMSGKTYG